MRNLRLYAAVALGGYVILSAQGAGAADWKLVEVNGPVRIATPGREATTASLGQVLPVGSNVTTGGGGRVALMNGAQRVVVGPNSRMILAPESTTGMTRVMQDLGSILFQVDRKPSQHFRVETPLLAAVVKGTTFTVTVGALGDAVHVAEGLVEVRAADGGATQDVPAGATGAVSRAEPQALNIKTPTSDVSSEPVPASVEPLDYAAASGGLVDAAPAGAVGQAQPGLGGDRAGNLGASVDAASPAGLGEGLQSARAAAAVMVAAQDNSPALPSGEGPGSGNGNGANPGNGNGNSANPGNGNGAGSNPGNGNGANPGNGNGNSANPGNGNGAGSNPGNGNGANPGNGNGNSANPGNGNGAGSNPGNGNGGNPGNGNGDSANPGNANPGNGNGNGSNPGNGNGATPGNGNGGSANPGNADPGNGNGNGANPGNGNGNEANPGNGNGDSANPGNGNGNESNPGNGNGNSANPGNGNGNESNPGNGNGDVTTPGNGNDAGNGESNPGAGNGGRNGRGS